MKMFSKFNILYESIMTQINESGLMVRDVVKIKRENIAPTIQKIDEEIFSKIGLSKDDWTAEIGSAANGGKKEESGDLDIAVKFSALSDDINKAKEIMLNFLNENGFETNKVGALISLRFPIQGSQLKNNEYVQVDLFNSVNLEYSKIKYHSPILNTTSELKKGESRYKGAQRFFALSVLIKIVSQIASDESLKGNVYIAPDGIEYPALEFKHLSILEDGIFNVTKSFIGNKGKILKNPKKDDLKSEFVTNDFQELLDMLFGKGKYTIEDLDSFESIWNNILMDDEFPYKDKLNQIILNLKQTLIKANEKNPSIEIPKELMNY